jgi:hypothetical protein
MYIGALGKKLDKTEDGKEKEEGASLKWLLCIQCLYAAE